jgi:hypothetical protein
MKKEKLNKRGIVWPEVGWWILALVVLAILIASSILLRANGMGIFDRIVAFFKGG